MNAPWTREETIIAFNVYCKIPFKDSRKTHPLVVKYAKIIGRTPSALNMKIGNIGRLDPSLRERGITGLVHGSKVEKDVWEEFFNAPDQLAYESERLIAQFSHRAIEETAGINLSALPAGKERTAVVRQRVNQSFFRAAVMSAYNSRCCISGISNLELLEACHITSWAEDESNRTNPQNGLCLNVLFHKAYDKQLLAITPDYEIKISSKFIDSTGDEHLKKYLAELDGQRITLPDRFLPNRELLELHYNGFIS